DASELVSYAGFDITSNFTGDLESPNDLHYVASGLPDGLVLSDAGVISGTPTDAAVGANQVFSVTATDNTSSNSITAYFTINVNDETLSLTPTSPLGTDNAHPIAITTDASELVSYAGFDITSNFTGDLESPNDLHYVASGLPDGLVLSDAGVISGTPTDAAVGANQVFSVTATDNTSTNSITEYFTINENDETLSLTPAS